MENITALDYAKMGAEALMDKFTAETLPPVNHFHYHQGVFLAGVERVYKLTGDEKYKKYIKAWVDMHIDENGNAPHQADTIFDDVQPCLLLFDLYRETGDERYKIMMDKSFRNVEMWPTNAKGGVWHMKFMDNQMWLDTMYMMGVFSAKYAHEFDNPYMFEKLHKQMKLMREYMTEPESGLLYHVWDDSKRISDIDPETGLIRHCWGRAIGWYVVAIAEILEYLPKDHHLRQDFIDIEIEVLILFFQKCFCMIDSGFINILHNALLRFVLEKVSKIGLTHEKTISKHFYSQLLVIMLVNKFNYNIEFI